jgi:hypothetical protein
VGPADISLNPAVEGDQSSTSKQPIQRLPGASIPLPRQSSLLRLGLYHIERVNDSPTANPCEAPANKGDEARGEGSPVWGGTLFAVWEAPKEMSHTVVFKEIERGAGCVAD